MKLSAKKLYDAFSSLSESIHPDKVTKITNIEGVGLLTTESAYIGFYGGNHPKYPNRPYLCLIGEITQIQSDLPFGINTVYFGTKNGINANVYYDFTTEQIVKLTQKGLFEPGFVVPPILAHNQVGIEIPIRCDFHIINPDEKNAVPIVFADVPNSYNIQTNESESGYDMASYFADYTPNYEYKEIEEIKAFEPFSEDTILYDRPEPKLEQKPVIKITEEDKELSEKIRTIKEKVDKDHILSDNAIIAGIGSVLQNTDRLKVESTIEKDIQTRQAAVIERAKELQTHQDEDKQYI